MRLLKMLTLTAGLASPAAAADLMSAMAAREAALKGDVVLIDIRTPGEWKQTGVPDVAHTLDLQDRAFLDGLKRLMDENPDKKIAVICATGRRSTFLAQALGKHGVDLVNVDEGMMGSASGPGWLSRSLPVRRPDAPRTE